jgi:hypothetical protein
MGFTGYRLGLEFVHEEVVTESENFVLPKIVGFLEKECSTD